MKKLLRHHTWTLIGMFICLASCSLGGPLRKDPKASGYSLGKLDPSWVPRPEDTGIDHVYQRDGNLISLSSVCGRYQDVPFDSLDRDLINPIQSRELLAQETRRVDGRDATFKKVRGTMDGVAVEAWFVALPKDGCLFDFSLIGRGTLPAESEKAFQVFVEGFHFGGSGS